MLELAFYPAITPLAWADKRRMEIVGRVLRKEDTPMGKFLVNVLAAVAAGVIVALIIRYFNV